MRQPRLILPSSPKFILRELLEDPRSDDRLKARILKKLSRPLGWLVMHVGRPRRDSEVGALRRLATNKSADPKVRFAALLKVIE